MLKGLKEAYLHNSRVSVRTTNKRKIQTLIFDIGSYVRYYRA